MPLKGGDGVVVSAEGIPAPTRGEEEKAVSVAVVSESIVQARREEDRELCVEAWKEVLKKKINASKVQPKKKITEIKKPVRRKAASERGKGCEVIRDWLVKIKRDPVTTKKRR